jgi:hypothetical protein
MKRHAGLILACLLLICCFGVACEKQTDLWESEVAFSEPLPEIPAEYGELEAVTTIPEYPGWFQMWFEDDAGTIRIVRVQLFNNQMPTEVKVIPRTQPVVEEGTEDEG